MTLADYLRTAELSNSAFAGMIGVSQVTVHRWIKGTRFPDKETILRIEDATGRMVKPADWFSQDARRPAPKHEGAGAS